MGSPTAKTPQQTQRLMLREYEEGILKGDRFILSRAITVVESKLEADQILGEELIQNLLPHTGRSVRLGITGVPGAGKSTFIEAFGKSLTAMHKKVAVLAIDPSSKLTQGSILGDKTRMEDLSRDKHAFIRPSSSAHALGGVGDKTREAILLCEAAGFDMVLVETIGVGQSEVSVRGMVDFFLLLLLGGAGDELQGLKKGIMEMADGLVITKADGDHLSKALRAQADYQNALHFLPQATSGWSPQVLAASALEKKGLKEVWQMVVDFVTFTKANGHFENQRKAQNLEWFHSALELNLKSEMLKSHLLHGQMLALEQKIIDGQVSPGIASRKLIKEFVKQISGQQCTG